MTPDVLGAVPDIAGGGEREELVAGQVKAVSERLAGENPGMDVEIKSFFGGNQYFAFVIEVFRDVRLVGAPPTSMPDRTTGRRIIRPKTALTRLKSS